MFTGLSGSGKSTVARALAQRICAPRRPARSACSTATSCASCCRPGWASTASRAILNIRRIGYVAAEIARHGGVAICAPIAPYAATATRCARWPRRSGDFVLVHVNTPLAECERRDLKGLYAKARAGLVPEFTGVSDPYEEPDDADLSVDTSTLTVDEAVGAVYNHL